MFVVTVTTSFGSIKICRADVNTNSNKNSIVYQVDTSPVFGKANALLLKDFMAFYEKPT